MTYHIITISSIIISFIIFIISPTSTFSSSYTTNSDFIFISGQLPLTSKGITFPGKISDKFDSKKIKKAVEITTANLFWNLSDCLSDAKEKIKTIKCCNIKGYLNCDETFTDHPLILNFSSNIIVKILGENGKHTRVAVGVSSLPMNSSVEIEGIFSIS